MIDSQAVGSWRFVAYRALTTVAILFSAMLLLFVLSTVVPGNPADTLLGPQASPEYARQFIAQMGLDRPVPERLLRFFAALLRGDLGVDVVTGRSVVSLVAAALPYTLTLTFSAIGLAVLLGIPLGALAALRPGSWFDHILAVVSVAVIAIPSFVIAIALLITFSLWLNWLPVLAGGGGGGPATLVLPVVALSVGWIGYIARLMRTSLLEVMGEGFIRTSLAYGLPRRVVVFKYALKNAVIPTIAVLGLGVGQLLGGAVLVEIVFARPGLGKLVLDAINARNYPVLQGSVFVVVLLFVLTNLVVDLAYAWIDPRLRSQR
jgi:peptide/nickel transport system permease protein